LFVCRKENRGKTIVKGGRTKQSGREIKQSKLTEWGIPIKLGKLGGEVLINKKIKDIEQVSKAILAKNTADGANTILEDFDIADMQATFDAYVFSRGKNKDSQDGWRGASISRRDDMVQLRKMQHLIARELINNPSFNNRDLE
tara:strand:+ start:40 stop:468 length:429 start_codon:yes stop_codon:yes gene_type:complete